jgi:hypothetical protein
MKKFAIILVFVSGFAFSAAGQTSVHPVRADSAHHIKHSKSPQVVEGRNARMRMQLQQIKQHKKAWHEVDSVQKERNRELKKAGQ